MKSELGLTFTLILLFACSPSTPPNPTPPNPTPYDGSVPKAPDSQSNVRLPPKHRQGDLDAFSLARTTCKQGSDFVDAIKKTAPLVVGVAAGDVINKRFTPKTLGTGIILSKSGVILAHYHTIRDFNNVRVRLMDGTVKRAEWMGEDRRSDLVLLKIEGGDFPKPSLASADTLSIGQWVSSLGSPFGLQQSVSAGLVSDHSRPYPSPVESKLVRFVQSDVVIHPGSSGGPLIDACGRIVAMNSAILGPGMSFSLRIDEALVIAEKLYSEGEFERGFIGIVAHHHKGKGAVHGLKIQRVVPNSPAAKAGIEPHDIVTHLNDSPISNEYRMKWRVATTEPGEIIRVQILRDGVSMLKQVEVDSFL
jgi:serine protease Do